ncbi:hypothetical protein FN846DRAFT_896399 [Sphaerosporella brunnea]|uniref:Uncharacterized protein n=1 Tax=Sphaerosporella brunnea TaxID=1250544 RepID=A0A5J5ECM7_9PEZI|nr:hypothetical protein FN846DRAFT_896399 [Sphaerosporella brunnea]
MPDQQKPERWCHRSNKHRFVTVLPKPGGNCHRCHAGEVRRGHETAMQWLQSSNTTACTVRRVRLYNCLSLPDTDQLACHYQMRNTPPRVLTEFPIVDDIESFRAILGAIFSMQGLYPEHSPFEIDDKNLAPEVNPTVYPIYAGKWQLAGHCQLYLYGDDLPCDVSNRLETLMDVVDPKETVREIAYSVMCEIPDSDQFAYVHATTTILDNGFTVHFVCFSDLASRDKCNPERDTPWANSSTRKQQNAC